MLPIDHPARDIPAQEFFDNRTQTFISIPAQHIDAIHLKLEHSLMSIARWESKWHKSFMGCEQLEKDEFIDYVRCMTINTQSNPEVYNYLTEEDLKAIIEYMMDPMSAWVPKNKKRKPGKKKAETVESVYCAMFNLGIPQEWEKRHFNQLTALIDYCASNGQGGMAGTANRPKSQRELMSLYHDMNMANRKKYHSKG